MLRDTTIFLKNLILKTKQYYYIDIRQKKNDFFAIDIPIKHYIIIISLLLLLCCVNVFNKYNTFLELKSGIEFEAMVKFHYTKNKNSERFKFQDTKGNILYGNYKGKFKNIIGKKVRVYGKIYKCTFFQFLKSCNIYNSTFSLLPIDSNKHAFIQFISNQHESKLATNLYSALFLATHLDKSLRHVANSLGLSHLIAISGFHLTILLFMFYAFVSPIYFLLHKYFCYRNAMYDLGLLGLIFAYCYLTLIDFEPSFFRAFIMACVGYIMLYLGVRIFNFFNLILCTLIALAFNVSLLFHIGFILSISGVFYIFLFIRYFDIISQCRIKQLLINIVLFNCIIFLQMIPIAHYFFPYFSIYQLISIPLSICFTILFPLLIIIHLLGYGYIFDTIIESVVNHHFLLSEYYTPIWFLIPYIIISLLSIRFKIAYILLNICAFVFYTINCVIYFTLP